MNELWTKFLEFLPKVKEFIETDFSINLVGLIGGFFGFVSFISLQLSKKLKLSAFFSNEIILNLDTSDSHLESIILPFSIQNRANRNFSVTDIYIKIYDNASYTPDPDIYHITKHDVNTNYEPFTVLQVDSYSTEYLTAILDENLLGRSKMNVFQNNTYTIEPFFVINGKKLYRLPRIESFTIYNVTNHQIQLSSVTKSLKNHKIEKKILKKKMKTHIYGRVLNHLKHDCFHFIKYKIILKPICYLKESLYKLLFWTKSFLSFLNHKFLVNTFFKHYVKKSYKSKTKIISEPQSDTLKSFDKLYKILEKSIKSFNNANIKISRVNNEIELQKNNQTIKIYMPGDGAIMVHQLVENTKLQLCFNLYKNYCFKYWKYNNKRISLYKMATITLDYVIGKTMFP